MGALETTLLVVLVMLVVLSAFFSASETAFTTANRVRLRTIEASGKPKAGKVLKMLDSYDKLLSAILVGNNIVNISSASIATVLFASLMNNSEWSATISTAVMTAIVLIFGEITPKSIVKENPENFCMMFYGALKFFVIILYPINMLFILWKKLVTKMFKLKKAASITEDELITYVETAETEGGIDAHESQLIRSAIEFDDLDVDDIMVPRVNVIAINENAAVDDIENLFFEHGFSRLPVYSETIDNIVGIIHEKDFYRICRDGGKSIKPIVQSTICVAPNMKISTVLRMLQKSKIHMAIVVDEFGGTEGIVTLEDILEQLVGEIWDEHDEVEELVSKVGENTYTVSGSMNQEDLFEDLGVKTKEEFDSTTLGGWLIEQTGHIPVEGEVINFLNLEIKVTKADNNRVTEAQVTVLPMEEDTTAND